MAENSAIEWCDSTFNPWIGCTRVSPACDDCYAARSTPARTLGVVWGPGEPRRRTSATNWKQPEQWQRQAAEFHAMHGRRRRVFCASLADVFDNEVENDWRCNLIELIEATPDLDWLLVTKRIGNVQHQVWPRWMQSGFPANVWLGITVINQAEADRDIPKLLALPARVRFLSIEPMLGPVDLSAIGRYTNGSLNINALLGVETRGILGMSPSEGSSMVSSSFGGHRIDWVICGGESGPKARPMHPDWARSLRDQCAANRVPFLFKQWGEFTAGEPVPDKCGEGDLSAWRRDQRGQHWNDPMEAGMPMEKMTPVKFIKVGKKAAGRLLDGYTHDEHPKAGQP